MKSPTPQTGLWALVLIVTVAALTLVALNVLITDGARSSQVTLMFMGLITLAVNGILNHVKTQKTLEVSENTDKKVDELLTRGVPERVEIVEARTARLEAKVDEIVEGMATLLKG